MGGALYNGKRLTLDDISSLTEKVKPILEHFNINRWKIPKQFYSKESFGDLDIICDSTNIKSSNFIRDYCEKNSIPVTISSLTVSLNMDGYQVDLLFTNKYTYSNLLYDWGDLVIYFKFLLKLLHPSLSINMQGLHYKLRYKQVVKDIFITDDIPSIIKLLDVDYDRYQEGFDSILDVFDWLYTSKYFDSNRMNIKYMSSSSTARLRKRPSCKLFVEYLNSNPTIIQQCSFNLEQTFPNLITKIDEEMQALSLIEELKTKFNGKSVLKLLPDYPLKSLSSFTHHFKKLYTHAILTYTKQDLDDLIMEEAETYLLLTQTY